MKLTFTPQGIAAMWLRGHCPNAENAEIKSLASLIEGLYADGVKRGLERGREVVSQSPTLSAADATLEADVIDLRRSGQAEDEGLDFDLTDYAKR